MPAVAVTRQPVYGLPGGRLAIAVSGTQAQTSATATTNYTVAVGAVNILVVVGNGVSPTGAPTQTGVTWTLIGAATATTCKIYTYVGIATSPTPSATLTVVLSGAAASGIFLFTVAGIQGIPEQLATAGSVVTLSIRAMRAVFSLGVMAGGSTSSSILPPTNQGWTVLWNAFSAGGYKTTVCWRPAGPSSLSGATFVGSATLLLANLF